jgi:lysozyme
MEITQKLDEWVFTPLNQNQFDALAAFVFNIGLENFRHSSVLRRINEGQLLQAACAMEMWRRASFEGQSIVIDALVRRRSAEKALFLTPLDGFLPAPTAILSPALDSEVAGAVPSHKPVEVSAALNGERATAERIGPIEDYRPAPQAEPEPSPTASEVAADAVISRLQTIPAEDAAPQPHIVMAEPEEFEPAIAEREPEPEPEAEPEPEFEPEAELEPEAEPAFALTSPAFEDEPREAFEPPQQLANPAIEDAPLFPTEPLGFDEFESQRVAHHEFDHVGDLDEAPLEPIRGLSPIMRWGLVALGGLILFAAGLFWMLSGRGAAGGGGHLIVGGSLGVLGITGVATAVYFLLERLGGREEQ